MASSKPAEQAERMLAHRSASHRDADNQLYDLGSDLVEAAAGIARLAGDPDAARAVPALLGCVETALGDLGRACAALREAGAEPPQDERERAAVERLERGYANLQVALRDAQDASRAARALAARRNEAMGERRHARRFA